MSQRRNIEDAFRWYLLDRQGLSYSWRGPRREVVVTDRGGHPFPKGQAAYDEADAMARELFEVMLRRLDVNRFSLEIVSAYGNLGGDDFGRDAVRDAGRAGEAVRLALATRETYPDDYTGTAGADAADDATPAVTGALLRRADGTLTRPGPPGYDLSAWSGERFEVVEAGLVGLGGPLVSVNAGDTVTAPSGWRLTR